MKKKVNLKLDLEIKTMKDWFKDDIDNMIILKANQDINSSDSEINKLTVSEFAELLINGYEVEQEYNIVNLPNVFRFTIPKGTSGTKYLCTVVKDRAVISWYESSSQNVNSYEYSVQEVLHHLNYKTWKMEGSI